MTIDKSGMQRKQGGSFIIEALISLLISTVALIGLLGLATQSVSQLGQTKSRSDASYLASQLVGEMWVTVTPTTFNIATWRNSARITEALTRLGNGVAVISGTEVAVSSDGTEPCGITTAVTTTQVFICISWEDKKNNGTRHFYKTATEIVKN